MLRSVIRHTVAHSTGKLSCPFNSQVLFSATRPSLRAARGICQRSPAVGPIRQPSYTNIAVMLSCVYTDLVCEEKVPQQTSSRGTTNTKLKKGNMSNHLCPFMQKRVWFSQIPGAPTSRLNITNT